MKGLTEKQNAVLTFIIGEMEENGFPPTVREIGNKFGITPKGAYDHMKAIEKKGFIKCHKNRSRAIEVLIGNDKSGDQDLLDNAVLVPLVGTVAAGAPILAEENIEEYVAFPKAMVRSGTSKTFVLKVKGDSMIEAGIHEGDMALIKQTRTANNGDIVVALIEDEATLKYLQKERNQVKLLPANKKYKPIVTKKVEILGKMIGLMRSY
jgi:repressor LexA